MKIFGHRGSPCCELENSIKSFKRAIEVGVYGIELDVYKCKSGELIVIHDNSVDRVSNGTGLINELSLEEIKNFKLKNGEMIPTLNEVLDLIDNRVVVDIELKGKGTGLAVSDIIKTYINRFNWSYDNFIVTSFDHYELIEFSKSCPDVKIGPLIAGIQFGYAEFAERMGADFIVLTKDFINEKIVDDAHKRGLPVFVYTVNKIYDFKIVSDLGVEGIITDYPSRYLN